MAVCAIAALVSSVGPVEHPRAQDTGWFSSVDGRIGIRRTGSIWEGVAVDLGADGNPDVVMTQLKFPEPGLLPVFGFIADGRGAFATALVSGGTGITVHPRHVMTADFNADGRQDVFIADHGLDVQPVRGGQSRILIQSADGALQDETDSRIPLIKAFTHSIALGDIDNDADVDIYMGNISSTVGVGPRFYLNDGTGHFRADTTRIPSDIASLRVPNRYCSSLLVDVDRDGDQDLVLGNCPREGRPRDALLLNDGKGAFTYAEETALPLRHDNASWGTYSTGAAPDLDGDGWPDLLMAIVSPDSRETRVKVYLNRLSAATGGSRKFEEITHRLPQTWLPNGNWIKKVFAADFNNDLWVDVMVEIMNETPRLWINRGMGESFEEATHIIPTNDTGQPTTGGLAVADFDGDGDVDFFEIIGDLRRFGRNDRPFFPAAICGLGTSPDLNFVDASGGQFPLTVTASDQCRWSARSQTSWVRASGSETRSGKGLMFISVDVNTGPPRVGTVDVNGRTIVIRQAGRDR